MKNILLVVLLAAVVWFGTACAEKANVEAETQAVKAMLDDYGTNAVSANLDWFSSKYYAEDAVRLPPNRGTIEGGEAIRASLKAELDEGAYDKAKLTVRDVKVVGDLAVARGVSDAIYAPQKGWQAFRGTGKWAAVYRRQADGSWRCQYDIWNLDQPAPGTSEGGIEEKALWQIEQGFFEAFNKSDVAALEKILAKEWTYLFEGQITTRPQLMADLTKGAYKVESAQISDFKAHVVGDAAIVTTTLTMKGTYKGADISSTARSIDIFVKQDGRWQIIRTQNTVINP